MFLIPDLTRCTTQCSCSLVDDSFSMSEAQFGVAHVRQLVDELFLLTDRISCWLIMLTLFQNSRCPELANWVPPNSEEVMTVSSVAKSPRSIGLGQKQSSTNSSDRPTRTSPLTVPGHQPECHSAMTRMSADECLERPYGLGVFEEFAVSGILIRYQLDSGTWG